MLMYWKTMFDRCNCIIIPTKCSVTFAKNVDYILLTFDSQHLSAPFINIRMPGPRASLDSRWPSSSDSTLMFQKRVHFKTRWSPTSV